MERFFLYDQQETANIRFVSFMGESQRYDLAIIQTDRYYGKQLILNLQSNQYAIIGRDDLDEPGYLEHVFQLNEEEGNELRSFLYEVV